MSKGLWDNVASAHRCELIRIFELIRKFSPSENVAAIPITPHWMNSVDLCTVALKLHDNEKLWAALSAEEKIEDRKIKYSGKDLKWQLEGILVECSSHSQEHSFSKDWRKKRFAEGNRR